MKKAGWGAAIVFCLAFLLPGWTFAARPLFTEDAGTAEKGSVEIELAFDHARDENRDKYYVPLFQIAYGLTERLEIAVGLPYIFLDPKEGGKVDGLGDMYAYLKYRIWEEGTNYPALALRPFLKFPTASEKKGLGSEKTDFGLTAAFSESFVGFNLHLDGTYLVFGEKDVTDQFLLGVAGEFEIVKGFNLVSEFRYRNNFNSSRKDDPATFMAGFQAEAAGAVFDAGLTLGLNNAAADYLFTVGVTLKFK